MKNWISDVKFESKFSFKKTRLILVGLVYTFKWKRVKNFNQFAIKVSKCMICNKT